jgi:replicative DNA helicase
VEISRSLKAMAKDLRVHVLALAAMNRDVEKQRRRPQLSDLRESGDLENDADEVMFIHQAPDEEPRQGRKGELDDGAEGPEKGWRRSSSASSAATKRGRSACAGCRR